MISDGERVVAAQLFDDAIGGWLILTFRFKRAEPFVEDDEHAAEIGIEIARVNGMMNAVMAGRVEHSLNPAREFVDCFCVHPELIDEVEPANHDDQCGVKAQQAEGNTQEGEAGERTKPWLT